MIVDGTDLILGRLASFVARQALLGETMQVVNCEKIIITGDKKLVLANYVQKRERGTPKDGPFIHRYPDRLLKRTIRGMVGYKTPRGREAFKRIRCYLGVPEELKDQKAMSIKEAHLSKLPNLKYVDLKTISKRLGAKLE